MRLEILLAHSVVAPLLIWDARRVTNEVVVVAVQVPLHHLRDTTLSLSANGPRSPSSSGGWISSPCTSATKKVTMGSVQRAFNTVAPCVCGQFCMTNRAPLWVMPVAGSRDSARLCTRFKKRIQVHAAFLCLSSAWACCVCFGASSVSSCGSKRRCWRS